MKYPLVSIIVVNYNGKKYLRDCVSSLFALEYPKDSLDIIIVDNGSDDDSVSDVATQFPSVRVIQHECNNYCKANNLGVQHARGEFVAFLNNDTRVEKQWLIEQIKVLTEDGSVVATGGKILFSDGRMQSVWHEEVAPFYWEDKGKGEKDEGQYDEQRVVDSVCGASMVCRKERVQSVGLFDERFTMYCEEVDLAKRLRDAGGRIVYVPTSVVYHELHGTAQQEEVNYFIERNRLFFVAKHAPQRFAESLLTAQWYTNKNTANCSMIKQIVYEGIDYFMATVSDDSMREAISDIGLSLSKIIRAFGEQWNSNEQNNELTGGWQRMPISVSAGDIRRREAGFKKIILWMERTVAEYGKKVRDLEEITTAYEDALAEYESCSPSSVLVGKKNRVVSGNDAVCLKGHMEHLQKMIENLNSVCDTYKEQLTQHDKTLGVQGNIIEELSAVRKENEKQLLLRDEELRRQEKIINDLDAIRVAHEAQIALCEEELGCQKTTIDELGGAKRDVEKQVLLRDEELGKQEKIIKEFEKKVAALEVRIAEGCEQYKKIDEALVAAKKQHAGEIQAYCEQKIRDDERITILEAEKMQMQAMQHVYEERTKSAEQQIAFLNDELRQCEQRLRESVQIEQQQNEQLKAYDVRLLESCQLVEEKQRHIDAFYAAKSYRYILAPLLQVINVFRK